MMYQKKGEKNFFFGGLGEEKSPENVLGGSIKDPEKDFTLVTNPESRLY